MKVIKIGIFVIIAVFVLGTIGALLTKTGNKVGGPPTQSLQEEVTSFLLNLPDVEVVNTHQSDLDSVSNEGSLICYEEFVLTTDEKNISIDGEGFTIKLESEFIFQYGIDFSRLKEIAGRFDSEIKGELYPAVNVEAQSFLTNSSNTITVPGTRKNIELVIEVGRSVFVNGPFLQHEDTTYREFGESHFTEWLYGRAQAKAIRLSFEKDKVADYILQMQQNRIPQAKQDRDERWAQSDTSRIALFISMAQKLHDLFIPTLEHSLQKGRTIYGLEIKNALATQIDGQQEAILLAKTYKPESLTVHVVIKYGSMTKTYEIVLSDGIGFHMRNDKLFFPLSEHLFDLMAFFILKKFSVYSLTFGECFCIGFVGKISLLLFIFLVV